MTNHRLDLISTSDGSPTVRHSRFAETYHSVHGAVTESMHVFIGAGLDFFRKNHPQTDRLHFFEMGLGTGLNALLTYRRMKGTGVRVRYDAVDKFPLKEWEKLDYVRNEDEKTFFHRLHTLDCDSEGLMADFFRLSKNCCDIYDFPFRESRYHVIYYDAFSPATQPELWTPELFTHMYRSLVPGGVWVTYVAKGQVRRDLQAAGFRVERLPGPPGKREMLRAVKEG